MIPDIVEIKRLCASGQWTAKVENGKILLHDTVAGETVCIGKTEAEPVRHGRWVSDESDILFHCSECETQISTNWDYEDLQWNYCPNCGAKMDGGVE